MTLARTDSVPSVSFAHRSTSFCGGAQEGLIARSAVSAWKRRGLCALAAGLFVLMAAIHSQAATDTVTSTLDDGAAGTLRSVIGAATSNDTIVFDSSLSGGTITLDCATYGPLVLGQDLTISGPGAARLAISGANACTVFHVNGGVTATIFGLTIQNGLADPTEDGGGISNEGTLTVSHCVVKDSNSLNAGGGIFNRGTMTLSDSVVSGNHGGKGGGVFNFAFRELKVVNSTLSGNFTVTQGGAIDNDLGALTVINSTLAGNSAANGGGISVVGTDGTQVTNTTISGNSGGGISGSGVPPTLKSTLLAGQLSGGNCHVANMSSGGYNLSDDNSCSAFLTAAGDQNNVAAATTYLGPLKDNGGSAPTIALLTGSTAIDKIPAFSDCSDVAGDLVTTDQRGVARPQGSLCDIGAVEATQVPTANVCPGGVGPAPCSYVVTRLYNFPAGTQPWDAENALTQGVPNLDFLPGAAGCAFSPTIRCYQDTLFRPSAPGIRMGAGQPLDASQHILASDLIYGIGVGPAIAFGPGVQTTLSDSLHEPSGIAVDAEGNVFTTEPLVGALLKLPAGGGSPVTVSSSLSSPFGVAVDGAGNIFVADRVANQVVEFRGGGGGPIPVVTGLTSPVGVAVDGVGNLFIAESHDVVEAPASGGGLITVPTVGLNHLTAIAMNANGDLYIADNNGTRVVKLPADGGAQTDVLTGLVNAQGLAVDAAGDLFVAVDGKVTQLSASGDNTSIGAGLINAAGVAVDGAGNVFISDPSSASGHHRIVKVNRSEPPALSYPATNVGNSSAAQSVTVQSIGNRPLDVSSLSIGANFAQAPGSGTPNDCSSTFSLGLGEGCDLTIVFSPLSGGSITSAALFTDNALNGNPAHQGVGLQGTGVTVIANATINTSPSGLLVTVDSGPQQTAPVAVNWTVGSPHTITAVSPQGTGTQYSFVNWFDGSTTTTGVTRSVTASASVTSYTATFGVSGYQLTTAVSPAGTGSVTPASGGYYAPNAVVSLNANPATGYVFSSWSGPVASATSASTTVTMNAAKSVTANFIPALGFVPPSINFGTVTLWGGTKQFLNITNNTSATVKFSKITLSNLVNMTTKDLTYDGGCMSSIAPGKVCKVTLSLWPSKTGAATALLNLAGNVPGSPLHVAISATIIAPKAALSASGFSFGNQKTNTASASKTVTLTNNGVGMLSISGIMVTGSNAGDFAISNNTCGSSLPQGSSCQVSVIFTPHSKNSRSATLKFTDNAQSSTQTVSLSGTGK